MAKLKPKSQAVMVLLVTLPMWINMLVRTYAWKGILSNLDVSREFSVYVGMVYNFLPFMILQIYTSLSKIDENLIIAPMTWVPMICQTFLRGHSAAFFERCCFGNYTGLSAGSIFLLYSQSCWAADSMS
jgi:spermidine/putrescine transport system permease protein